MRNSIENRDQVLEAREAALAQELQNVDQQMDHLASLRGVCFLFFVICFAVFFWKNYLAFLVLGILGVLIFAILVVLHNRKKQVYKRILALKEVHDAYIARTRHDFTKLSDDGSDLMVKSHAYAGDLDLFGPKSLFALINVAHTAYGRKQLQNWLLCASEERIDREEILARQQAVSELAQQYEKVEELEATTKMNVKKKGSPSALLAFIKIGLQESGRGMIVARILTTVGLWISVILGILISSRILIASGILLLVQFGLMTISYKQHAISFQVVEKFYPELRAYAKIFTELESVEVQSAYLQSLRKRLYGEKEGQAENQSASNQLYSLYRISLMVQARMQPLLYFLLNIVFLYDELCLHRLNQWREVSGNEIPDKLLAIGEWEALMSLSVLDTIYPDGCKPEIVESAEPFFHGVKIGHPLIPTNKLVRNDFSLDRGCAVITGSNMSGKTTLLRTVGINTVLAMAGATCPSASLSLSVMRLAASMRIEDDLGEGVSTFYAELLKIERIVRASKSDVPLLYLIDEIFRGTNSKDRTDGAWTVLKKLHRPQIIGMMSTHDYELCKMADKGEVDLSFYHFSEFFDDEGMHFDYLLKDGMSTETNAKYLMRMVGIDDSEDL